MPNANGHTNGHGNGATYDMEDGQSFLFTSESVGEGHPGENIIRLSHQKSHGACLTQSPNSVSATANLPCPNSLATAASLEDRKMRKIPRKFSNMADPLFSRGSMRSVLMSAAAQIIICRACLLDFRCLMNETPVQRNVSGRLVNGWGISLVRENRYTEFPWNLSAGVVGEHVFRNRVTARGRVHTKPTTCYPKPISKQKQRMISAFLPLITFDSTNLSRQSLR